MTKIRVCIAGATGWTGRALVAAVVEAPDLELVSAVSRSAAGRDLGEALGGDALGVPVHASVADALDGVDVLIDYTSATAVKANALAAIEAGVAVVIGSSGLTAADFEEIDAAAHERAVGVVASGNFSLTAAMCQAAALLAARHLPQWEVIDYASATKPDVPSRDGPRARRAPRRGSPAGARLPDRGSPRAAGRHEGPRSAAPRSTPFASRASSCPPRSSSALPDERLTIRHDAGGTPEPYVAGHSARRAQGARARRAHARARHALAGRIARPESSGGAPSKAPRPQSLVTPSRRAPQATRAPASPVASVAESGPKTPSVVDW